MERFPDDLLSTWWIADAYVCCPAAGATVVWATSLQVSHHWLPLLLWLQHPALWKQACLLCVHLHLALLFQMKNDCLLCVCLLVNFWDEHSRAPVTRNYCTFFTWSGCPSHWPVVAQSWVFGWSYHLSLETLRIAGNIWLILQQTEGMLSHKNISFKATINGFSCGSKHWRFQSNWPQNFFTQIPLACSDPHQRQ